MRCPACIGRNSNRRGGVLFEVVLAVALFGGAAAFTLAAARSALDSMQRVRLQQAAVDLAKTRLAQLEAGLIALADLRDGITAESDSSDAVEWTFDLKTGRTEFTNLTLIELTVRQTLPEGDDRTPISCTLKQLMALRPDEAVEYERDELSEGTP